MKHIAERVHRLDGFTVHTIHTDKFKTNALMLMIKAPLEEKTVSQRALLAQLFQNGTERSPSRTKLRERLEAMYGATFTSDVQKKGENHVIAIRLDVANERFLSSDEPLFQKALSLLAEVVLSPRLENGVFPESVVHNEKRTLSQRIQSIYDDKIRYANMRVTEEMCKREPYALPALGKLEDVDAMTSASLYRYYEDVLKTNAFDLYVLGDVDERIVVEEAERAFRPLIAENRPLPSKKVESRLVEAENVVHEEQDVNQGKLHIGFRTYTTFADEDYVAMQVCNGLFGGFSHSKLFLNVREKESLAYYASSQIESHKGLMFVMSGIEFANYDRALSIIKEQLEAIQRGDFTDEEVEQTKAMVINQLLETTDVARGFIELSYHQVISGHTRSLEKWIEEVKNVTKEDVVRAANKIRLDTIYFLKGKGNADEAS